jgi:hypothetical protein
LPHGGSEPEGTGRKGRSVLTEPKAVYHPVEEEEDMSIRYVLSAAVVAAMVTMGPVQAQQQPATKEPSKTEEVKTWSLKQWNKARAEFAKDKAKWASCRQQNKEQKLRGKASWSFLYNCMKS